MSAPEPATRSRSAAPEFGTPADPVRPFRVRRRMGPGILVPAAIAAALLGLLAWGLARSENAGWPVVGEFMFNRAILEGVLVTIELTLASGVIAAVIGLVVAWAGRSENPVAGLLSRLYIWFFRGVPLIVLLLFFYNIALFVPQLTLGIPWTSWTTSWDTNEIITGFSAALLGLSLHEGSYMAEIFRTGFNAIPKGQTEAALSIGMKPGAVLRKMVMPQSFRIIIPALGNQLILLMKTTSLVSVIGGGDLLTRSQYIYGQNLQVIPLLLVATIWYLVLVTIAQVGQHQLERHYRIDVPQRRGIVRALLIRGEG